MVGREACSSDMVVFTSGTIVLSPRLVPGCDARWVDVWCGCGGTLLGFWSISREAVVQLPDQILCWVVSWWIAGVGLLFEIWIVDASIFVVCCRQWCL